MKDMRGYGIFALMCSRGSCSAWMHLIEGRKKALLIDTLKQIEQDPDFQADAVTQGMSIGMKYGDDFEAFIADTEATMTEMKPLFGW